MSDPIKIEEEVVTFSPDEIDIDKFLRDKKEHIAYGEPGSHGPNFGNCYMCWYLRDNSEVDNGGNLLIRFGKGNSGHTQNTLNWTIREILDNYIKDKDSKNPKKHTFIITDIFGDKYPFYVEFSNSWVERLLKHDSKLFGKIIEKDADCSNIHGTVSFNIEEFLKKR